MKTGVFWVTFARDLPWFKISAKSYRKFASGWDYAKVVVPTQDGEVFKPVCDEFGIELLALDEWPDNPFNWHQFIKCCADIHIPEAEHIYHLDADAIFAKPVTPADWLMPDGKIILPYTPYEAFLKRPEDPDEMLTFMGFTGRKIDFERGQYNWKFAVEWALGHKVTRECMAWCPIVHNKMVYEKTRALINERWKNFDGYVRGCRGVHPQSFCEFNTLGAVAFKYFEDLYHWHNLEGQPYPFYGKVIQSWSHGGLDREHDYSLQVSDKTINTPRKLFVSLGLIT
jgi:hypothetical protein